jgi:hypothetical protein
MILSTTINNNINDNNDKVIISIIMIIKLINGSPSMLQKKHKI